MYGRQPAIMLNADATFKITPQVDHVLSFVFYPSSRIRVVSTSEYRVKIPSAKVKRSQMNLKCDMWLQSNNLKGQSSSVDIILLFLTVILKWQFTLCAPH